MKKMILSLSILAATSMAHAQEKKATIFERMQFCDSVEAILEEESLDAALDKEDCLAKAEIKSTLVRTRYPFTLVSGVVEIKPEYGPSSKSLCAYTYKQGNDFSSANTNMDCSAQ